MTYLASPYSDPNPAVREHRFILTSKAAAYLTRLKHHIVSPILHWHQTACSHDLPTDAEFWKKWNLHQLSASFSLLILDIPGWEDSLGVKWEHSVAAQRGIPIRYFSIEHPTFNLHSRP